MNQQEQVYYQFYNFDFENFPEYQEGWNQVLESYIFQYNDNLQPGQPEITDIDQVDPAIQQQLKLQAQVYFFCEKTDNILSLDDYFEWKHKFESNKEEMSVQLVTNEESSTTEPPYSSNYEKIVDLIVHGKPVPGIIDIPDVLNEEPVSKQELQPRKKPWERKSETKEVESLLDDEKFSNLQSKDAEDKK